MVPPLATFHIRPKKQQQQQKSLVTFLTNFRYCMLQLCQQNTPTPVQSNFWLRGDGTKGQKSIMKAVPPIMEGAFAL